MRNGDRIDALEKRFNSLELRLDRERDRAIERASRRSTITPSQHYREIREAVANTLWVTAFELVPPGEREAWVRSMAAKLSWIKGMC